MSNEKQKIERVIVHEQRIYTRATDNRFTWGDIKEYLKELDIQPADLDNCKAKIIDFGNCEYFNTQTRCQDEISIRSYRPPENFMNSFFNDSSTLLI